MQADKKNMPATDASKITDQINHGNNSTTLDEKQSRIDEATNFFNLIFGSVKRTAYSYLWTLPNKATCFFDVSIPENRRAMAQKAVELSNAGFDVYFGVNLQNEEPATGRGKEEAIAFQTAVIADIDTLGGKHTDPKKYPASFDMAKTFLPFEVSLFVNSGYGSHDYCIYQEPIEITDETRTIIKARDKKFIDAIRANAAEFSKAVDSVGDLTRVLRVPGTRNYKLGVSTDAPICHIVEVNDLRFSPVELDEKLNALTVAAQPSTEPKPAQVIVKKSTSRTFEQSTEFDDFRVRRMLDVTPVGYLHGQDWFTAMTAIKNLGFTYDEFDAMNQGGENYDDAKNRARWDSDTDPNIGIGALYNIAVQYGYDAQKTYREWYNLHPNLRPSAKRNTDDKTKRELDDAIIWLDTLEPENFTANDARDNCRAVALAAVFGFHADVEKFFSVMKAAKKISKERLKDDAADLTKKLSETERLELSALAEGVNVDFIRRAVDRQITAVSRERDEYLRQVKAEEKKAQIEEKRRQKAQRDIESLSRLEELRAMEPSPERNAEMIQLIRDSCEWHCNQQGVPKYIEATAANVNKIFTNDPNIDKLFGYDDFLQADVFLKPPIWAPQKKRGDEWQDRDDAQLQLYLRENYGEFTNEKLIANTLIKYSDTRHFHEVQDYFKALPKWDGKPRAETLFIDWFKVPDTPYSREVTNKFLLAAVARIFHPGCEFQWALVLRGNQKIGKGYIFKRLGGKWYKPISDRVDDPHAVDTIRLVWIGEFKEMAGMRKADVNAIKDFIELSADTRRLAYARRAGTYPRHCVFVITVNDNEFLSDVTGNRRFLVLDSPLPKFGYVKEVRGEKLSDDNVIAQIWAEVYHRYNALFKDGFDEHKLELSAETELKGEEIAETYMRDDGLTTEIKGYLDTQILPPVLWQLLTRDERRDFIKNGRLVMLDAVAEFNHRRRARGGKRDTVQDDVDFISDWLEGTKGKDFVRSERKTIQGTDVKEYILYGSELRQRVCSAEIFNECFGSDNRKRMPRINEILAHLDGWHLGARLQKADPAYPDQTKPYYRD